LRSRRSGRAIPQAVIASEQSERGNPHPSLHKYSIMQKHYYVYIMTNENDTVLYTGITSNLKVRVYQHKNKLAKGFTNKYNVNKLVYAEVYDYVWDALRREKQIKSGSRQKKIGLVNNSNPEWKDLSDDLDYE